MAILRSLGIEVEINPKSDEVPNPMSEFLLMYDNIRCTELPKRLLLEFLQSTYEAGAELANWDRHALERSSKG